MCTFGREALLFGGAVYSVYRSKCEEVSIDYTAVVEAIGCTGAYLMADYLMNKSTTETVTK